MKAIRGIAPRMTSRRDPPRRRHSRRLSIIVDLLALSHNSADRRNGLNDQKSLGDANRGILRGQKPAELAAEGWLKERRSSLSKPQYSSNIRCMVSGSDVLVRASESRMAVRCEVIE